jgi:hypothetical protein
MVKKQAAGEGSKKFCPLLHFGSQLHCTCVTCPSNSKWSLFNEQFSKKIQESNYEKKNIMPFSYFPYVGSEGQYFNSESQARYVFLATRKHIDSC